MIRVIAVEKTTTLIELKGMRIAAKRGERSP
jgi:hypothetical protein